MQATHKPSRLSELRRFAGTRRGATIIAMIAAGLAALVLLAVMSQYKRHVQDGTLQKTALVAVRLIPKGTSGTAIVGSDYFKPTTVRQESLRAGAITSAGDLKGRVATRDILPGEQLTADDFESGADPIRGQLQGIQRGIAIPLADDGHGMVGVIRAGDHVDVLAGFNGANGSNGRVSPAVRTLAENVLVLKAPAASKATSGNDEKDLIVRVDADVAARMAFAADNGKVWFVLRPPVGAKNAPPSAVSLNGILTGAPTIEVDR